MATFFIVDDEPILHELYKDILEIKGHEIVGEAYNGNECIEKLVNDNSELSIVPDFVIMDHRMPIQNGLETMNILLEKRPELKVIFISADETARNDAMSAGSVGFIKKPFNMNSFFSSLENLL
jgi:response regulator NasT